MDACLQHDPRTKQQIKDILYEFLYTPVQKQFKTRLDTLITRNAILGGYSHNSFSYKGVFYSCDTLPPPPRKNRLLAQLRPVMDEYLEDLDALNEKELPYVIGFINQVLNASNDLTDYLRLLPTSVHQPLERLIATCPCKTKQLTDEKVDAIKDKAADSIALMKARLVKNLLI